jgi:hypothetical protein
MNKIKLTPNRIVLTMADGTTQTFDAGPWPTRLGSVYLHHDGIRYVMTKETKPEKAQAA